MAEDSISLRRDVAAISPTGSQSPGVNGAARGWQRPPSPHRFPYQTPTRVVVDDAALTDWQHCSREQLLQLCCDMYGELMRVRADLDPLQHRVMRLEQENDLFPGLIALNQTAFLRELGLMLDRFANSRDAGAVLLLHVGGLDLLRQVHGRAAGQAALGHITATLRSALRQTDLLAYLDGGDFALALSMADPVFCREKAGEILRLLATRPFHWNGLVFVFHGLCGLEAFRYGLTAEGLLAAADAHRRSSGAILPAPVRDDLRMPAEAPQKK